MAGNARRKLEAKTGAAVLSKKNYLGLGGASSEVEAPAFNLETAVGRARVGRAAARRQGWSREFGQHAARLRNGRR